MKPKHKTRPFGPLALGLCAALTFSSCVDSSYDFSKDIDLTMGLGSSGLGVRFGNTEPITLDNLLKVDKSVKLEDGTNRYYLVENGTTEMNFNVDGVTAQVSNSLVHTSYRVLSYDDVRSLYQQNYGQTVPDGTTIPVPANFDPTGSAYGKASVDFTIGQVPEDINELNYVSIKPVKIAVYVRNSSTAGVKFKLSRVHDAKLNIPKIMHVASTSCGTLKDNVLTVSNVDCSTEEKVVEIVVDGLTFGTDNKPNANHEIVLSEKNLTVSMDAKVDFSTSETFNMTPSDYADVYFDIVVDGQKNNEKTTVVATEATGRFSPTISPDVDPIEIGSSLPDFLQDDDVRIAVTNPTLRFSADLSQIPVDLDFSGSLSSELSGKTLATVTLPATGKARLTAGSANLLYFYQGASPYDPEQSTSSATATYSVDNLGSLITRLPDHINIDLKDGRISVPQTKDYTIQLDRSYRAQASYSVFVPFEFKDGLTIVYNDTTSAMNDDLKDYAADGVRLTGNVENTVPLALVGTMSALDTNGNVINGINFSEVHIAAGDGTSTPVTTAFQVEATLDNPQDLSRVDRIVFRVTAESGETAESHSLVSTQYLRLTDVRLRLLGGVVADFN